MATTLLLLLPIQGVALGETANEAPGEPTKAPINPVFLEWRVWEASNLSLDATFDPASEWRPSPIDPSLTRGMQVSSARLGAPPASYDLRTLGRVTGVRNQAPLNTCWAFASIGSLESCLLPGETWDLSEDNMLLENGFDDDDPGEPDPGEDPYSMGNHYMATAYLARWGGPVGEADDPYGDGISPPDPIIRKHVQDVDWIPARGSATDNLNLKNALLDEGAVYASMYFSSYAPHWNDSTDSYHCTESQAPNHAVLIVGWDDGYAASNFSTTPPGSGAFIVKNSYGAGWGAGGYFYVSYYDTALGCKDDMALFKGVQDTGNYGRIYQYDPLGHTGSMGWVNDTAWFANVFTAQETGKLSAVGFYTPGVNSTYEVYTGTSMSGGTLVGKTLRTSGTIPYKGYHTVGLPGPVDITSGQQFVVAVKLVTPGLGYPVPLEEPFTGYSSAATASPGQSYVSDDGSAAGWDDVTTFSSNANVCLKAFSSPPDPPSVTGLGPDFGSTAGGTTVTIAGGHFLSVTDVTFDGAPAESYIVDSSSQITAVSPAHAVPETVDVRVTTAFGSSGNTSADDFTYMQPVAYSSYRGDHRYHTAQLLAQAMFSGPLPAGSGLVVAPGETFPEALCGAPLAAAYGGPVLVTPAVGLENGTRDELIRLAPTYVFVIGLSTAVSDAIEAALPAATVIPIDGADVYEMSYLVAKALEAKIGDMSAATGIVTIGTNFPDAIGVSPLACARGWPILVTDSGGAGDMNAFAVQAMNELGITSYIKAGTYASDPPGVVGLANLSGLDRYDTCAKVADWSKTYAGLSFTHTGLATGDKFPDALASGPYLAQDQGILLLSPLPGPLPTFSSAAIAANRQEVERVTFIAMLEPVVSQVKALLP